MTFHSTWYNTNESCHFYYINQMPLWFKCRYWIGNNERQNTQKIVNSFVVNSIFMAM